MACRLLGVPCAPCGWHADPGGTHTGMVTDKNRDKKNTASTRLPYEQAADEEYRQLLEDRREAEKMIAHAPLPYYPDGEAMVKDILS